MDQHMRNICEIARIIFQAFSCYLQIYVYLTVSFVFLPSLLGLHTGVHHVYLRILDFVFYIVNRKDFNSGSSLKIDNVDSDENNERKKPFHLEDVSQFVVSGISTIIDDDVTQRFRRQRMDKWNLLVRSVDKTGFPGVAKYLLWCLGMAFRYGIILPHRFMILTTAFAVLAAGRFLFPLIPSGRNKQMLASAFNKIICRIIINGFGIHVKFHYRENIAKSGIVVSNHTTPLDALILCSDSDLKLTGQLQEGFFGLVESFLIHLGHVFFDRSAFKDRGIVVKRLKEHADNPMLPPILVFPEGVCINNSCIMMFRKGSFEYSQTVHPIAIKYDLMYGDMFWDSLNESFVKYLLKVITSWLVVCKVWYLPPMERLPTENAADMANKVQVAIAQQCGVRALQWDGALKRSFVPESMKKKIQREFASSILIP